MDIKLCKSFKFLSANMDKILNNKLKEKDLSITQGIALIMLWEDGDGELPIKVLEKKFGTAQSTTLGVVNRLEQKGLVTSYLTEHRTKIVKITQEGLALLDIIRNYALEADELFFTGFSLGERFMFIELLKKAENNILQQRDIEMEGFYE